MTKRFMNKSIVLMLAILLITHIAHVIEEILGKAWFIDDYYGGLNNFIMVMLMLFLIPLVIIYFVLKQKSWAYYLSIIYASVMILDALTHIVDAIIYKKYYHGSAGVFTGIIFIIIGSLLIYFIIEEIPSDMIMEASKNA